MNYRHLYHAGNFADAFKHCILIGLVEFLYKKDTPLLYLDTHAGIGKYDLTNEIAQKTREYENGIMRIYNLDPSHAVIKKYQQLVKNVNANAKTLHFYPGSPLIMRMLLRPQDQMILIELHQEDVQLLKRHFHQDKLVAIHHINGYQGLKAFLPPKCGRGLILIDPAFEEKNEFQHIITGLEIALDRFPTGVYMIWYPLKNLNETKNFYTKLKKLKCQNILATELILDNNILPTELNACGVIIINTPWQFAIELESIVSWLSKNLAINQIGKWHIKWLKTAK